MTAMTRGLLAASMAVLIALPGLAADLKIGAKLKSGGQEFAIYEVAFSAELDEPVSLVVKLDTLPYGRDIGYEGAEKVAADVCAKLGLTGKPPVILGLTVEKTELVFYVVTKEDGGTSRSGIFAAC